MSNAHAWFAMYTYTRASSGVDDSEMGRLTWRRQGWADNLEEVLEQFEDWCKQRPQMSYVVITPKGDKVRDPWMWHRRPVETPKEPFTDFYAGFSKWDGKDFNRILKDLKKDYTVLKERPAI